MARFGINATKTLGVPMPVLRKMAKDIGKDHGLAIELWQSGIHEARILASLIADPERATDDLLEKWVKDFDSWDVCDQCCSNFFDKTRFACTKAVAWSAKKDEFIKRAGFVLMAVLSVHDRKTEDETFIKFLPIIQRESDDNRNFVKKAVNWALRQIGKRNERLNKAAICAALKISKKDSAAARWIAADALRELKGETAQRMIQRHVSRETMKSRGKA